MFVMSTMSPSSEILKKKKGSIVFQTIGIDQTTRCHDPENNNFVINRMLFILSLL